MGTISAKPNKYFTETNLPYGYQWTGVKFLLTRKNAILNDDTGLGKSLQAIVAFSYYKHKVPEARALVLMEKSVIYQWAREFQWLTPDISVGVITAETHDKRVRSGAFLNFKKDVLLTTYSMLYKHFVDIVKGLGANYFLICDEPNAFKNLSSKLNNIMQNVAKYAPRRVGLTAMLFENRLEETYALFKVFSPETFRTKAEFTSTYCKGWKMGYRFVVTGHKNLDLFRKAVAPVVLRRAYDHPDVQQEMPEETFQNIEVPLGKEQSERVVDAMRGFVKTSSGVLTYRELVAKMAMQQQVVNSPELVGLSCDSAKLEALSDLLRGSLAGERVVITTKYRKQVDIFMDIFKKEKRPILRITGKETAVKRRDNQLEFEGSESAVLFINKAGSKGLNLQAGRFLIHYDLPWGFGTYKQFLGRLKRTGSVHTNIVVYQLLATLHPDVAKEIGTRHTIDHYTLSVLQKKRQLFHNATDGLEVDIDNDLVKEIFTAMTKGLSSGNSFGSPTHVSFGEL